MADGYIGLHTRRTSDSSPADTSRMAISRSTVGERAGTPVTASLVAGLRAVGAATAVIEYAGRKGARIVLVGPDGTEVGEQFAESTEAARTACANAGLSVEHEWERELTEQMRVTTDLWGARGRRALTR